MRTRCIGILGKCYMGELPTKVEEELNWLKSLKERYTWKPTEEHMKTLNEVINYCANGKEAYLNDYIYNRIIDLRDELNKL